MAEWWKAETNPYMQEYKPPVKQPAQPARSYTTAGPSWLDTQLEGFGAAEAGLLGQSSALQAQIDDLQSMLGMFTGAGDVYTRWMIDNSIYELEKKKYSLIQGMQDYYARGEEAKMSEEVRQHQYYTSPKTFAQIWEEQLKPRYESMEGVKETARMDISTPEPTGPPMPDWMKPLTESSMQYGKSSAEQLRPLGAQADMTTQKLEQMQGYLGWGQAGAPKYFSQDYVNQLQNLPGWWNEYVTQSKKLHPVSRKRTATWRPSTQG